MEYEEFENVETANNVFPNEQPAAPQDILSKVKALFQSAKGRKIAILVCAAIVLIAVVAGITSHNSPESVAERFVEAATYSDAVTMQKLAAFDYYNEVLYYYDGDEEAFFEWANKRYDIDVDNWKDYSKDMAEYSKEELSDEYGEYKITIEATKSKDISVKKLEEECDSTLTSYEKHGSFDRDDIKDAKIVTVKFKIAGEDETERTTLSVYMVKVSGSWKVLYADD